MALNVSGSDSLYWKTGISNAGLIAGATQAKGILASLASSVSRMDVFAGLAIGSAFVFSKMTREAYNFSKDFETAMKEVQTISKSVQGNFDGISKELMDMSKTVPDDAKKLAKALYQIVSAGYDGAEAMDLLRVSAELAVAGVTDTFTAADALTYVMNAYGEAAGTAEEISDKLFTTVKLGKVKMEELGPTISMVTGLAAEAGLSFNELSAMYAEAVKKIQPHIVSTGIRGIITAMLRVSKGTGEAAEAAKELGVEFDIQTLKSKGFKAILNDIIVATKGNEGALMQLFPNVRGLIGLLAVMTNEGENYKNTLDEITNSTGATSKAFKIMMETTDNQLAILKNNITAKMKPLGDSILRSMNNVAKGINIAMSGATDELSRLSRGYSDMADTMQRKKSKIDDLVATIEGLRDKTELSKEETTELEVAERALSTFFPTLGKAAEDTAKSFDILTTAKNASKEISIEIAEYELKAAEIKKIQAKIALEEYILEEDQSSKNIENIKKEKAVLEEIIKRKLQLERTGEIEMWTREKFNEELDKQLNKSRELEILNLKEAEAVEGWGLEGQKLQLELKAATEEAILLDEALVNLKSGKPVAIPTVADDKKDPTTPTILPSVNVEKVEDQLKYMSGQYKLYMTDIAQFGKEYVLEHNEQLTEDGENYGQYLSNMLKKYEGNSELTKIITDDIYQYNKSVAEKRIKIEAQLFNFISDAREKELQKESDTFDSLIAEYEEGSAEYIEAIKQHNINITNTNLKYDQEIADAALEVFKENLDRQIGEIDNHYKKRLEIARSELYQETEYNKEYFDFITLELNKLAVVEASKIAKNKETLKSYFDTYTFQTTENKIIKIHAHTVEMMKLTDDKYELEKLKNIDAFLVEEIKYSEAVEEITELRNKNLGDMNNDQLREYIANLETMKTKYSKYADEVILIDKKIAESQGQIWDNIETQFNNVAGALNNLASIVGNFDTELESTINNIASMVSGVGQLASSLASGNKFGAIAGIATIVSSIINLFTQHNSDVPELLDDLSAITIELSKQQTILNQSTGEGKIQAIKDTIVLMREQIQVYEDLIVAEQEAYGQFLWWTWDETDQESIDSWLQSIESVNNEIYNLNQQYSEILTGTTAETIANSIAEGFASGLDSAQIFADTFNDMMKTAIIDAFKRTIITKYLGHWLDGFTAFSEGGLTADEMAILAERYLMILQASEDQWNTIQDLLASIGVNTDDIDDNLSGPNITGLTGAIAGITEDTAGILAGQFQAIRINTVEILGSMENIIVINSRIADNTEYNKYLENISNKLDEIGASGLRAIGG